MNLRTRRLGAERRLESPDQFTFGNRSLAVSTVPGGRHEINAEGPCQRLIRESSALADAREFLQDFVLKMVPGRCFPPRCYRVTRKS